MQSADNRRAVILKEKEKSIHPCQHFPFIISFIYVGKREIDFFSFSLSERSDGIIILCFFSFFSLCSFSFFSFERTQ